MRQTYHGWSVSGRAAPGTRCAAGVFPARQRLEARVRRVREFEPIEGLSMGDTDLRPPSAKRPGDSEPPEPGTPGETPERLTPTEPPERLTPTEPPERLTPSEPPERQTPE
ncbi:hypothetical protein MINTM008_06850 [Mycobacterium intracellulare]|nr:hypothetical protein MINTM006_06680 [Mycobacterium intracellulare]BCP13667.1 hypothetical protein MINTM021_05760 [Mycobacterium paraintracellulare]BCP35216.1 hypothetical protein MINTMi198_05860 [Mycobacterium intracellulare M.i.198]BCO71350.1 hypothetical protein MINTM008_06850 [Mycobacterium intracellulare]BCO76901.1 hypothetical protein MINTM009_06830 [Mycobacterium intracellulare]